MNTNFNKGDRIDYHGEKEIIQNLEIIDKDEAKKYEPDGDVIKLVGTFYTYLLQDSEGKKIRTADYARFRKRINQRN